MTLRERLIITMPFFVFFGLCAAIGVACIVNGVSHHRPGVLVVGVVSFAGGLYLVGMGAWKLYLGKFKNYKFKHY